MTTPAAPAPDHHTSQHPRWPDGTPILIGDTVTVHAGRDHAWDGEILLVGARGAMVEVDPASADPRPCSVHISDLTRIAPGPIEQAEALGPDNGFGHDDCDPAEAVAEAARLQAEVAALRRAVADIRAAYGCGPCDVQFTDDALTLRFPWEATQP